MGYSKEFRIEQAKRPRTCNNCGGVITRGEWHIRFEAFQVSANLCLTCEGNLHIFMNEHGGESPLHAHGRPSS